MYDWDYVFLEHFIKAIILSQRKLIYKCFVLFHSLSSVENHWKDESLREVYEIIIYYAVKVLVLFVIY